MSTNFSPSLPIHVAGTNAFLQSSQKKNFQIMRTTEKNENKDNIIRPVN